MFLSIGKLPAYLCTRCCSSTNSYQLRSSKRFLVDVPRNLTALGTYYTLWTWNHLQIDRTPKSIDAFKSIIRNAAKETCCTFFYFMLCLWHFFLDTLGFYGCYLSQVFLVRYLTSLGFPCQIMVIIPLIVHQFPIAVSALKQSLQEAISIKIYRRLISGDITVTAPQPPPLEVFFVTSASECILHRCVCLFVSIIPSNQDILCLISVLSRLGLPCRSPASEQPLRHQPVINILNKPADGWSLSPSIWKGCSWWPIMPQRVNESFSSFFFPTREYPRMTRWQRGNRCFLLCQAGWI